ncbi:MAG TPA: hypothetical protein VKB34_14535, partial [Povalibacter sp.]|nr:hypothetical protein [Povalibacter sp.]
VVFGWKPWNGGTSSHQDLPVRIDALGTLRLSYAMQTRATGKYSLATTLWLTRTGTVNEQPNPRDISTDLTIWMDGFSFPPFGSQVDRATIDDVEFEIWLARDLNAGTADGPRWNYVAYRSTHAYPSASLNLHKVLQHAIAHGFVSATDYVSDVEIGNEIMSGAGETWVKTLALEIERR